MTDKKDWSFDQCVTASPSLMELVRMTRLPNNRWDVDFVQIVNGIEFPLPISSDTLITEALENFNSETNRYKRRAMTMDELNWFLKN
jgi:hypothetical protein